jgi:hypothetical protein
MEKWIIWLLAIPVIWFAFSITYQMFKLLKLWLGLKMEEIVRRIDL